MRRLLPAALACLAALATTADAKVVGPQPIYRRTAQSEVVIVGKVTGFADKTVSAPRFPGDTEKTEYQIAIVQVTDALLGGKGLKEIKVAFIPQNADGPIRPNHRNPSTTLTLDEEAVIFLNPHFDAPFFVPLPLYGAINKTDPQYDKELEEVKRCTKLLSDPTAGLKAKEADDRVLTAALLVARYRTPAPGATKTEAIDADQCKRILQVLADADWSEAAAARGLAYNPQYTFAQLGLTEKEGWTPPADFKDFPGAAKKWLKDNAEKFRIQRFVAEKKDK